MNPIIFKRPLFLLANQSASSPKRKMAKIFLYVLKKWLGLPQSASWAIVHDTHGLSIKSFEHLYKECRSLTLANIRFFSDGRVRHALDSKEQREGNWRRKFSSSTYAKGLIEEVVPPIPVQDQFST